MNKIIIMFNSRDSLTLGYLGPLIIGAVVLLLAPCLLGGTDAPYLGNLEVKIRCHPSLLYRGDDLVVEFGSSHDGFDFGLQPETGHRDWGGKLLLLSFKPGKNDHISPVISPQKFAAMRQITLNTATARGSYSNFWRGDEIPRALKPPELIFTKSGGYEILLGLAIGSEDAAFNACSVEYRNKERRPGANLGDDAILGDDVLYAVTNNTFGQNACNARTFDSAVTCPATTVYRGERLALNLDSENPAGRIGIVDPDWNIFLLPAENNGYGAPPGINIFAGSETARAYSYDSAISSYGTRSEHVETKAGRIFTKSGWYIAVSVPGPKCDHLTDIGGCWIHYLDAPPPR